LMSRMPSSTVLLMKLSTISSHKSLYGLKQAPRAWYHRFADYLRVLGFTASVLDTSLFFPSVSKRYGLPAALCG
jgi:hypothetical protein